MDFSQLINIFTQTDKDLKQVAYNAINQSLTIRNWLFGFYIVEFDQNGEEKAE
ncbi:MAG: hypothetical protein JXL97_11720 [Bacteroidales bacterium]|nr:hypothetical protein [Bacteroidales bacterium]